MAFENKFMYSFPTKNIISCNTSNRLSGIHASEILALLAKISGNWIIFIKLFGNKSVIVMCAPMKSQFSQQQLPQCCMLSSFVIAIILEASKICDCATVYVTKAFWPSVCHFVQKRTCSSRKVLWGRLECLDNNSVYFVIPVWWSLKEFVWIKWIVEALWWCIVVLALAGLAASLQSRLVCCSFSKKTK